MNKKKKRIILVSIILVIIIGVAVTIFFVTRKNSEEKPPVTNVSTVTNKIENYNYTLDDRDTKLFQEKFELLKKDLESENIDELEYAKLLAELFIIDLYTIENKISKYDIGGLEYVHEKAKDSFRSKVLDTIYSTVEDNSYKTRKQELPIVKNITIESSKETTYQIDEEEKNGYEISLTWEYEKDLGYDNKGTITLIKEENVFYVISYKS